MYYVKTKKKEMKSENPLVSIEVCTYNQEEIIAQTLDSILQQNIDFPIEIVVGEDCSTDNTRKICIDYKNRYPDVIQLILHEKNQGMMKNYKSVIEACKGKYIAQCGGDDYWHHPDKLKLQVDFLENNPDYGLVHSATNILEIKTGEIRTSQVTNIPTGSVYRSLLLKNHIWALTVMFRRELLQYINIDNFIQNGFLMEDYPMWLEFSNHTKFHWINIPLTTYRKNTVSASYFSDYKKLIEFNDNVQLIKKYYFSKYPENITEKEIDQLYVKKRLSLAIIHDHYQDIKYFAKLLDSSRLKQRLRRFILSNRILYEILYKGTSKD